MNALLNDMPFEKGEEVAVLINGLGSTPLDELYIMMGEARCSRERSIKLYRAYVGEYATSMEMAGVDIPVQAQGHQRFGCSS